MLDLAASVGMTLATALRGPFSLAATGTIEVLAQGERHRLFLHGGYVVGVELAGGQDPLGLVLAEEGLLTLSELQQSLHRRVDDLYGVSLVRESFLSVDGVTRGLRAQMARRVARICSFDDARFSFAAGPLPKSTLSAIHTRLHPLELLLLAARHPIYAQRSLARVLPLKARRLRLIVSLAELRRMPGLRDELVDAEWSAIDSFVAGYSVGELILSCVLPPARASGLVEALLLCGVLKADGAAPARPGVSATAAPSRSAGERTQAARPATTAYARATAAAARPTASAHARPATAPLRAWDNAPRPSRPAAPPPDHTAAAEARPRDPARAWPSASRTAPRQPVIGPAAAVAARAAAMAVAVDPLAHIRLELRRGGDAYRLLEVEPGSGIEVLRAAYRRRALLLHPDRWDSRAPADLSELFAAVTRAYRTLSTAAQTEETRRRAVG